MFGKRTDVYDAHDRYASVDVDCLLQWLRAHRGVVIIESNVMPGRTDQEGKTGLSQVVRFARRPS